MLFVICFWRCFNFELKYLSSQWRVRKVMICFGKVCYSSYIIILAFVILTILKAVIPNWRNGLDLFSLLFTQNFWHWVIFKLKYLCSQLSDRKVIICVGKVCSSSFRISPDFFDFDNSKGSYSRLKISSPFFWTHCSVTFLGKQWILASYRARIKNMFGFLGWTSITFLRSFEI